VKRYEGLFILNTTGKEEGIKEAIDKISKDIESAGGKVETTQKMDKRSFSRVADKKYNSGFYVNVIFQSAPSVVASLRGRFALNEEIFRVLLTEAPPPKEEPLKTAESLPLKTAESLPLKT
jgi:small subunit ribosomal protein S6